MKRRSILAGFAAIITTPGLLMPVRKIVVSRFQSPYWPVGIASMQQYIEAQRRANELMRWMMDNANLVSGPSILRHSYRIFTDNGDGTMTLRRPVRKPGGV